MLCWHNNEVSSLLAKDYKTKYTMLLVLLTDDLTGVSKYLLTA